MLFFPNMLFFSIHQKNTQHGVKHAVCFILYKAMKQEKEFERERKKKPISLFLCVIREPFVS